MRDEKYQILFGKFQGQRPHGRSRPRSEDNNKVDRKNGVGINGLDLSLIILMVP
jgi:hypothetical protein